MSGVFLRIVFVDNVISMQFALRGLAVHLYDMTG